MRRGLATIHAWLRGSLARLGIDPRGVFRSGAGPPGSRVRSHQNSLALITAFALATLVPAPAIAARDLAFDHRDNLLVVSSNSDKIRSISPSGHWRVLAGADGQPISLAGLRSIAYDSVGRRAFVADHSKIYSIAADGSVSILAGSGERYRPESERPAGQSALDFPLLDVVALAHDPRSGTLFAAEYGGLVVAIQGGRIYPFADLAAIERITGSVDDVRPIRFRQIRDMAVAPDGSLYALRAGSVQRILFRGQVIDVLARAIAESEDATVRSLPHVAGIAFRDETLLVSTDGGQVLGLEPNGTATELAAGDRNNPVGPLAVNSTGSVSALSGEFGKLEVLQINPSGQERRLLPPKKRSDPLRPKAITGGRAVPRNQALAVVAVDFFRGGHCTGSLIAPEWVLTAAHCLVDKTSDEVQFRSAVSICNDIQDQDSCLHWRIPTDRTIVHPRYRWFTADGVAAQIDRDLKDPDEYDVALLHLTRPVHDVRPMRIADITTERSVVAQGSFDHPGVLVGWGQQDDGSVPRTKRTTTTRIWYPDTCISELSGFLSVARFLFDPFFSFPGEWEFNHKICAGESDGRGTASGDSGGPLLVRSASGWVQIGVLFGTLDARPYRRYRFFGTRGPLRAFYTRTSWVYPWIDRYANVGRYRVARGAAQDGARRNGERFRDCAVCPELAAVPAGTYRIGSPAREAGRDGDEGPRQQVTIEDRLAAGVYEVTKREWDACVAAGGCPGSRLTDSTQSRLPVSGVSWYDAQQYVAWLTEKTGRPYRLPTEQEWEYLARAGTSAAYHFGAAVTTGQANYGNRIGKAQPVGTYPANRFGLRDMHGNVFEWVQDCYDRTYDSRQLNGRAWVMWDCSRRVIRGGGYRSDRRHVRSADRGSWASVESGSDLGFRVVRTMRPESLGTRRLAVTALARRNQRRRPGDRFLDCAECPEMVVLPGGAFQMGSPAGEAGRASNEGPRHRVEIAPGLAVGVFEVSFREWDACVDAGGCAGYRPDDRGWGRGQRPAVNVSWTDAQSYVAWLNERTGAQYRLLSEAEWEYAARAGATSAYAFGDQLSAEHANLRFSGTHGYDGLPRGTVPVGLHPANRFGLHDMHGNVYEWVTDTWHGTYQGASADGTARTGGDASRRVVRGGSWSTRPSSARAARRTWFARARRMENVGFRVARRVPAAAAPVTPPPAADDHPDTRDSATRLALGGFARGMIETGSDRDYFRLDIAATTSMVVFTTGNVDTVGTLFGPSNRQIATNDNGGPGRNFRIASRLGSGAYYLRVESKGTATGSYILHARRLRTVGTTGGRRPGERYVD